MQDETPSVKVERTTDFEKSLKKLNQRYRSVREDLMPLIEQLEAGEIPGDRISGNKYPVYKVRVRNSDNKKGQSGGYRVIYYTITLESILLSAIYSKSDRLDIDNTEIEEIIARYEREVEWEQTEIEEG